MEEYLGKKNGPLAGKIGKQSKRTRQKNEREDRKRDQMTALRFHIGCNIGHPQNDNGLLKSFCGGKEFLDHQWSLVPPTATSLLREVSDEDTWNNGSINKGVDENDDEALNSFHRGKEFLDRHWSLVPPTSPKTVSQSVLWNRVTVDESRVM